MRMCVIRQVGPRMRPFHWIACICLSLLSGGCAVFKPDYVEPGNHLELSPEYHSTKDHENSLPIKPAWWCDIEDPQLKRLQQTAVVENFSIARAKARVWQAYAAQKKAGSSLYPSVSLSADAGVTEREESGGASQTENPVEAYGLGVAASYELDLWGSIFSSRRAESLRAQAAEQDLYTAAMTVSAEVGSAYMSLLAQSHKLDVLRAQVQNESEILSLVELRFGRGRNSVLDVLEQRSAVKSAQAAVLPAEAQVSFFMDRLSLLVGGAPGSLNLDMIQLPDLPPEPDKGIPSDLLYRRPDVVAAWMRLLASEWDISEARANRLPNLKLSVSAGYDSAALDTLFDAWILRLIGELTAPLIDAGSRKAEVIRQKALKDERLAAYRETVLNAVLEVQDAARREHTQKRVRSSLEEQLELARQSYQQALRRYGRGQESFLRVLNATAKQNQLELAVLDARLEEWKARIALYRALGGGWEPDQLFDDDIQIEPTPDTESDV